MGQAFLWVSASFSPLAIDPPRWPASKRLRLSPRRNVIRVKEFDRIAGRIGDVQRSRAIPVALQFAERLRTIADKPEVWRVLSVRHQCQTHILEFE